MRSAHEPLGEQLADLDGQYSGGGSGNRGAKVASEHTIYDAPDGWDAGFRQGQLSAARSRWFTLQLRLYGFGFSDRPCCGGASIWGALILAGCALNAVHRLASLVEVFPCLPLPCSPSMRLDIWSIINGRQES